MRTHTLENDALLLRFDEECGLAVTDKASGNTLAQLPSRHRRYGTRQREGKIRYEIDAGAFPCSVELSLAGPREIAIRLDAEPGREMPDYIEYPPPWRVKAPDKALLPIGCGYALPVGDPSLKIPSQLKFYSGMSASMSLFGVQRGRLIAITGLESGCDAETENRRDAEGLLNCHLRWLPEKGRWGYDRGMRIFFANSLPEAMLEYRNWRKSMGWVKTLREKAEETPAVRRLPGCANVWLWDDDNMNRLYGSPERKDAPPRDVRRIAKEMRTLGMERVLWNAFEGETRDDCAYLKSLGYLVGKYDVYRDVIPADMTDFIIPYRVKRSVNTKFWPGIVRRRKDGSPVEAWALHGMDGKLHSQHSVCDACALELTKRNVPPDVEAVGYDSRFIDVQAGATLTECYAQEHPCTRTESAKFIRAQQDYLSGMGLVNGVEVGAELFAAGYHFAEGMPSPCEYRAKDSGRRMTTLYYGEEVPAGVTDFILNPRLRIPLWELVYHDCAVNYYYWGDSSNSCPELMETRDLFCALYGFPPIYSVDVSGWKRLKSQIAASYARATESAYATALSPMIGFERLSEDALIQRSVFENGVTVTANFSQMPYHTDNGKTVMPMRHLMERN